MFENVKKLFRKPVPIPAGNRWYFVVLRIYGNHLISESATPRVPLTEYEKEAISDTCYGYGLFELAPNETTAYMKAMDRCKHLAAQRFKENELKQPATKQDVEDLRSEVISLKEFIERKHNDDSV